MMLPNDEHFRAILHDAFGCFPFRRLPGQIAANQTGTEEVLVDALAELFAHPDAAAARNVLFFWAVENPFQHANGKMLISTISYIEITSGRLADRWPRRNLLRATRNGSKKGIAQIHDPLHRLADLDKGFWFYSRLIREHGPLAIYYATLLELNAAAVANARGPKATVREWERTLIRAYRHTHGVRPLKNRRC
jgi:hypothetical protein